MIIYAPDNSILLDLPVDDTSYRYRAIRQQAKVYLYYSLAEHVEVPVGSYIEYEGQRYTLWRPEDFTKHGTRNLEYSLTLGDDSEWLNRIKYKHLSAIPPRLKFPLTGSPRFLLQLLIDNLNEADGGWSLGTCIEASDKTLSFSHEYCGEVLDRMADEWGTEYEIVGKQINFGKVEYNKDAPLPLSYGRGNGFKTGVGRQNYGEKAPVTLLYVQGGERNIDPSAYGSSILLLPKSQELEYEGRRYKTDANGLYITRADRELKNRSEDSYDASDIYPSRVGTVSEVIVVDAANNLYDIIDNTIPDNLDFAQYRIAGERATIVFQSGILTGEEFDLEQTDEELTGYVHAERRFKLVPVEKEGGTIPNENRKPSVGDTYAIFNIALPPAYVCDDTTKTGASWDMFREAVRYLYEKEEETFAFSGELDGIWSKSRWLEIGGKTRPGSYVLFSDTQFQPEGINIRITGVKDYINKPHSPEVELSNTPVAGFLSSELGKIDANEVKGEEQYNKALQFTKRRYRDAIEAQNMLEAAFDNYSKGIDPIWVRTMSLLVGDESLQFRFVSSRTNPETVEPDFRYDDATGIFTAPALILQHMTLGIKDIKQTHEPSEYQYWDLAAYTSPYLGDFGALYLYAKCGKSTGKGEFLMSEKPHKMEEGNDYYFLVGLLGSQFDGVRSFTTVYGFTEILPGRITVDKIVSADGQTYFVLNKGDGTGEIHGKIILTANSSGLKNFEEWEDVQAEIEAAQSTADDAVREIGETKDVLTEFQNTVNTTFKDELIETSEAKAIEKYINTLNTEKADADAVYARLHANPFLPDDDASDLAAKKSAYDKAHTSLVDAVQSAIADRRTDDTEKAAVDAAFTLYNTSLSAYQSAVEAANEAIQNTLKGYSDDALAEAKAAHSAANAAQDSADDAGQAVSDLDNEVKTTFRDGVLTDAEKISIEKYLNTVGSTMSDVRATYTKLYANPYLEDPAKSGLKTAYDSLVSAYDSLTAAIEDATEDSTATEAEFAAVNTCFTTFNQRLNAFKAAIETANEAIQTKLKEGYEDADAQIKLTYDSKIENLGSQISASVTAFNEFKEEVSSAGWITTADGNKLWARKDGIISAINQSPESISIDADRINLNGTVTFSMFSSSLQDRINGKADTDDLGALAMLDTVGESQLSAALKNSINNKLERGDMGDLAFKDKIGKALLDETLIKNGVILTTLIDTDAIYANMAQIGDFSIESGSLVSNKMKLYPSSGLYFEDSGRGIISRFGAQTIPSSTGVSCNLFLRNTDNSGTGMTNGACMTLEVGNPTNTNGQKWISCSQASGWGAGFTLEAKYVGDDNGMSRTCITIPNILTDGQLKNKFNSSPQFHFLVWDIKTGMVCMQI